jgi:hypothetical protein
MNAKVKLAAVLVLNAGMMIGANVVQADVLPKTAMPMSPAAVVKLYAGRTWLWSDGAGYFEPNQRFLAWSGKGKNRSYINGRWFATQRGEICFQGVWHSAGGGAQNLTCFDHRKSADGIYQRKTPVGAWYVFRHSPPVPADEANKLAAGDRVSSKLPRTPSEKKS